MTQSKLGIILRELDAAKQRATYGAVGGLLGQLPRSVMGHLPRIPKHSWVVLADTHEPSGYAPAQMHPELRSNAHVIADPDELRSWLDRRTS